LNVEEDTLKEAKRTFQFATKNKGKFDEAARIALEFGIELTQVKLDKYEIQSDDLHKIAAVSAEHALREIGGSAILTEDAGFFIRNLGSFPGPYSSYAYRKLGVNGILKLLENVTKREAYFACVVAYCCRDYTKCFEGIVSGKVSLKARGRRGFGFDPIFIPNQGNGRTFGEMDIDQKNRFSHRALAFAKFCRWSKSKSAK